MTAVLTNLGVYLWIAEEALSESTQLLEIGRSPKPDGQPGYILSLDPERKSFKQSFIAIAFSGMYLEALFGLAGNARLGQVLYNKIERRTTYEEKLRLLGFMNQVSWRAVSGFAKRGMNSSTKRQLTWKHCNLPIFEWLKKRQSSESRSSSRLAEGFRQLPNILDQCPF